MNHLKPQKMAELIVALESIARKIRTLEAEAAKALHELNDASIYQRNLEEKTWLLLELPETLEPLLKEIGEKKAKNIRPWLASFARRAEIAMELSSSFYMAALLYPEDYKDGGKNDLEIFIEHLQNESLPNQ